MSTDLDLNARRQLLLARSTELRLNWTSQAQALRSSFGVADRAREGVNWLVSHPQWPIGALVVLVLLKPRRVLGVAGMAWTAWGMYRRAQRTFALLGGPRR
jgi:hypothetical protein